MATTLTVVQSPEGPIHGSWVLTENDATPEVFSQYGQNRDRSFQVFGTFGGGTVILEGSNEIGAPTNWVGLRNPAGTALSFTVAGLMQILEFTRHMRARVTAGAGVSVTCIVYCGRSVR